MRIRYGIGWVLLLSLVLFRADDAAGDPVSPGAAPALENLLPLLSDDDYHVRESAARRLVEMGEPALGPLRIATAQARDLEVRLRTRRIVRDILQQLAISKSTGMTFAPVDAGTFWMGSPSRETNRRDDESAHFVRITGQFLIGVHEVTQQEFQQVMGFQPSDYSSEGTQAQLVSGLGTSRWPVEGVSWFDALEFCNRLSKADGYPAYYAIEEVQYQGKSIKAAKITLLGGSGFRLPTEAEWEYACRAGTETPFHFGVSSTGREANLKPGPAVAYGGTSTWKPLNRPTRVGSFPANLWGLCDTHGNVNEWCWDWYAADYDKSAPATNPQGPASGTHRVARGGSWLVMEGSCRSASRLMLSPDTTANHVGFRVARSP